MERELLPRYALGDRAEITDARIIAARTLGTHKIRCLLRCENVLPRSVAMGQTATRQHKRAISAIAPLATAFARYSEHRSGLIGFGPKRRVHSDYDKIENGRESYPKQIRQKHQTCDRRHRCQADHQCYDRKP